MCSRWCWNLSKLHDSSIWEAYINSSKMLWWCSISFMNAKLFREWIFNFTNVDFWHFSIPHKLEMIKKPCKFSGARVRSRWWKRNCIESCPIKSSSGLLRHLLRFSYTWASPKSSCSLKCQVRFCLHFCQQLCSVYPIVI